MKKILHCIFILQLSLILFHFHPMSVAKRIQTMTKDEIEIIFCETEHIDEINMCTKVSDTKYMLMINNIIS